MTIMSRSSSRRLAIIIGIIVVAAILTGGYLWLADTLNPFNDHPFNQKIWLALYNSADSHNPRGPMADDLCKRVLHTGMTRREVESLLGKPDAGGHGGDAPPSPKDGNLYSYNLGHWKCPFCESTLDVAFDDGGKFAYATIVTH